MFDNSLGVTILHIMEGVKARIELRLNPCSLTSWRRLRVGMNGNNYPIDVRATNNLLMESMRFSFH